MKKQKQRVSQKNCLIFKFRLGIVFLFINLFSMHAQDALFTNYLSTPLQTNPALIAFDNDLKIFMNYRGRVSEFAQSYNMPALSVVYPLIRVCLLSRSFLSKFALHPFF